MRPPFSKDNQKVVDRPIAQGIGQLDGVADDLVAFRREENDIALRVDLAGFSVPVTSSAARYWPWRFMRTSPRRSDDVGIGVVSDPVGAECYYFVGGSCAR